MIDIHSHILPQMDDGSKSIEETAALLELLQQQGVTTVVATPHFYATQETPQEFLKRRQQALRLLSPVKGQPRLLLGAEVKYFSGIGSCEDIIPLQIENTNLLLVEMPFCNWSQRIVQEICNIPSLLGLTPILAHVDRYMGRQQLPKYLDTLLRAGVLLQCNAEAFAHLRTRRRALKLLKKSCIHFLGSDCHNLSSRPPKLQLAREAIEKKLGAELLADLTDFAAEALCLDKA